MSSHIAIVDFVFFFNDTATTEIYTLSLHDALPAVHGDADPGEERRARGGEEADEVRDVLRARDPLERVRGHRFGAMLLDRLPRRRSLLCDQPLPALRRRRGG